MNEAIEHIISDLKGTKSSISKQLHFQRLDVMDVSSIEEFVHEYQQKHNKLHLLVNNAGKSQ